MAELIDWDLGPNDGTDLKIGEEPPPSVLFVRGQIRINPLAPTDNAPTGSEPDLSPTSNLDTAETPDQLEIGRQILRQILTYSITHSSISFVTTIASATDRLIDLGLPAEEVFEIFTEKEFQAQIKESSNKTLIEAAKNAAHIREASAKEAKRKRTRSSQGNTTARQKLDSDQIITDLTAKIEAAGQNISDSRSIYSQIVEALAALPSLKIAIATQRPELADALQATMTNLLSLIVHDTMSHHMQRHELSLSHAGLTRAEQDCRTQLLIAQARSSQVAAVSTSIYTLYNNHAARALSQALESGDNTELKNLVRILYHHGISLETAVHLLTQVQSQVNENPDGNSETTVHQLISTSWNEITRETQGITEASQHNFYDGAQGTTGAALERLAIDLDIDPLLVRTLNIIIEHHNGKNGIMHALFQIATLKNEQGEHLFALHSVDNESGIPSTQDRVGVKTAEAILAIVEHPKTHANFVQQTAATHATGKVSTAQSPRDELRQLAITKAHQILGLLVKMRHYDSQNPDAAEINWTLFNQELTKPATKIADPTGADQLALPDPGIMQALNEYSTSGLATVIIDSVQVSTPDRRPQGPKQSPPSQPVGPTGKLGKITVTPNHLQQLSELGFLVDSILTNETGKNLLTGSGSETKVRQGNTIEADLTVQFHAETDTSQINEIALEMVVRINETLAQSKNIELTLAQVRNSLRLIFNFNWNDLDSLKISGPKNELIDDSAAKLTEMLGKAIESTAIQIAYANAMASIRKASTPIKNELVESLTAQQRKTRPGVTPAEVRTSLLEARMLNASYAS